MRCVLIYHKRKTRSCAPEIQSSAANRILIYCPLVLFGLPKFLTSSSAPLALLLLFIVSKSKRRGCAEVRAEGGRVKLCHPSAEVLVHVERTGRDRGGREFGLSQHSCTYVFASFVLTSIHLALMSITHRHSRSLFEKNILNRCQTPLVPQVI